MKKIKIISIILLLFLCIGGIIYREVKVSKIDKMRINIHDITSSGAKSDNIKAYVNASIIGGVLPNYENNLDNSFYVVFGDDVQYIIYMDNNDAREINRFLIDNPSKTYKILGVTKLIPKELEEYGKDFVKNWLDQNHDHGEEMDVNHTHEINEDEFYKYFGYIYLDSTISKYSDFKVISIIIYTSFILSLLLVFSLFYKKIW